MQPAITARIPAGTYWIDVISCGSRFRIVDVEGNQAADTLFFSARDPAERYSAVDTIREQRNVYLTTGSKLLSTEGNVLAEIIDDTVGRHDTLGGACAAETNQSATRSRRTPCTPAATAISWRWRRTLASVSPSGISPTTSISS